MDDFENNYRATMRRLTEAVEALDEMAETDERNTARHAILKAVGYVMGMRHAHSSSVLQ